MQKHQISFLVGINVTKKVHFASLFFSDDESLLDCSSSQTTVIAFNINAAHNVVKNNATFKTYYDRKAGLIRMP